MTDYRCWSCSRMVPEGDAAVCTRFGCDARKQRDKDQEILRRAQWAIDREDAQRMPDIYDNWSS